MVNRLTVVTRKEKQMFVLKTDVAYDWPFDEFCTFCERYDAKFEVIEAIGPGGGNPYVKFSFPKRLPRHEELMFAPDLAEGEPLEYEKE